MFESDSFYRRCSQELWSRYGRSLSKRLSTRRQSRILEDAEAEDHTVCLLCSTLCTCGLLTCCQSTLVAGPYPESHKRFVEENGIQHFQVAIEPNKDPFVTISHCSISFALGVLLDKTNYPILVHCNKGKVCTTVFAIKYHNPLTHRSASDWLRSRMSAQNLR